MLMRFLVVMNATTRAAWLKANLLRGKQIRPSTSFGTTTSTPAFFSPRRTCRTSPNTPACHPSRALGFQTSLRFSTCHLSTLCIKSRKWIKNPQVYNIYNPLTKKEQKTPRDESPARVPSPSSSLLWLSWLVLHQKAATFANRQEEQVAGDTWLHPNHFHQASNWRLRHASVRNMGRSHSPTDLLHVLF